MRKRLYHLTSEYHLPMILRDGLLLPTESNIGAPEQMAAMMPGQSFRKIGEHQGPDVAWFFDTPTPSLGDSGRMLRSAVDKTEVLITVEVDDAQWWPVWSKAQGIDRAWYGTLAKGGRPQEWWVVERPVERSEWVSVSRRDSPEILLDFSADLV